MNKVTVLVEGYAHPNDDGSYTASPTAALIETENKKILVDPGTNSEKLLEALKAKNLNVADISFIYLSHYHPDHFLNIRLFPNIDIYDGGIRWSGDKEYFYTGFLPETDIEILKTPGHSPEDCALLINTKDGNVCIAPDVFWWEDGKQNSDTIDDLLNLVDPFATDTVALLKSRRLIIEKSDFIIPGHGKMFKTPKLI
ncbi:MBL fold metallo-hydrolase [Candidatus Amesbacteria bacterium]|nr:MBL fold metallo-hydrolase [Candidatus Amesbacteria bacterium]